MGKVSREYGLEINLEKENNVNILEKMSETTLK